MQAVLKDGFVVAIHEDEQSITGLYPGCLIIRTERTVGPSDPDPRTDDEKAVAYRDQRRIAYPPIGDQLDMIYWDQINGTTVWRDTITAVKTAHPKP